MWAAVSLQSGCIEIEGSKRSSDFLGYRQPNNTEIALWVTVPDNGGAILTRYHGVCSTGTNEFTAQSARSQITVTGLTTDTPYTCTLSAENRVGVSESSEATPAITPKAMSSLPIWLLYEAARAR